MPATTAFETKFAEKGIYARNTRLQMAIAEFQNNGGEFGIAYAILCAAYGKGREAVIRVPKGHAPVAASPLRNEIDGQKFGANKATCGLPSISPNLASGGRQLSAEKAGFHLPATSKSKPGHAKRGLAAIQSVQATMSKSLFDTIMLPDGRRLREVAWSECPALATKYRKLSRILKAIHNIGIPADPNDTIDNIVNEDGLKEIVSAVEKFNDIY